MIYKENVLKYEDYFNLRHSVGWSNFSKEQAVSALQHSLYDIIAVDSERVVGMGRLVGDGLYCVVVDIVVAPDYQHRGIGCEIVRKILDYADGHAPSGSRTCVQLISEKGKESFYENMGFKLIPHENCGCGMRKIIYKEE
ncbi:MAG: GNAT family N-acetyltransferase [Clostridiaceae bacterium]|nr:GNAT family N-acetyltransferase [Clostridiaceae bacterium]